MLFTIIGISDDRQLFLPPDVLEVITRGRVFTGGVRHREVVAGLLPEGAEWIDITVPIDDVFVRYEGKGDIVAFASGDPLFFGFANTVRRKCPDAEIILYPSFNSLQMLAHRLVLPYHDMRCVSLTGRPWCGLDEAVISGERLIGVLTDKTKTPSAIARRLLDYGYDNYRVAVGENLGNRKKEQVSVMSLLEAAEMDFSMPNCVLLERVSVRKRPFGIPESEFELLNGRVKMITKMPVRLLSLSMLGLRDRHSFWDVGFCTGSVSIEAKFQFPHLDITAFEQRSEGEELMRVNSRRFGTPGITTVIGDFLNQDLKRYPRPDAVFIGGHGGRLAEILVRIREVMLPGGTVVFNSVSEASGTMFVEAVEKVGMRIVQCTRMTIDSFNTINVMKAE
jgi:precorrin-6Y C5,15-methyltransferase (decarboxylating)